MSVQNLLSPFRQSLFRRFLVRTRYLNVGPNDVLIASYPKSGNTWLRFMLAEAVAGQEVDFRTVIEFVPRLAARIRSRAALPSGGRLIKTHEQYCPPRSRAVYLVRDVRAVFVSYYHHSVESPGQSNLTVEQFFRAFMAGRVDGYGTWRQHVAAWLSRAESNPNMLLVRYEDLRTNTTDVMAKVVSFLGLPLDGTALRLVIEHNSFERMRQKESVQPVFNVQEPNHFFVRKGETAGWKKELPIEIQNELTHAHRDLLDRLCYE